MRTIYPLITNRELPHARMLAAACFCLVSLVADGAMADTPALRWSRLQASQGVGAIETLAVAFDSPSGRLAVGGTAGASIRISEGPFRSIGGVRGVTDLYFDRSGALWIATATGLWVQQVWRGEGTAGFDSAGNVVDRSPGTGDLARIVRRIRGAGGILLAATDAGAFLGVVGSEPTRWARVVDGLPSGSVAAGDLRLVSAPARGEPADVRHLGAAEPEPLAADMAVEVWLVASGRVWRGLLRDSDVLHPLKVDPLPRPSGSAGLSPVEVVAPPGRAEVVLVYPRFLAVGSPTAGAQERGGWKWQRVHPSLPPGASIRRLGFSSSGAWLATDAGLLRAASLDSAWRRAAPPAGAVAVAGLTSGEGDVYAATTSGVLVGRPLTRAPVSVRPSSSSPERSSATIEPDVRSVQRAALRYLDLGPERMRALARGVDRRGWLPSVDLRAGVARDRGWRDDRDEAFISGDFRRLHDQEADEARDVEALLTLRWDLGDVLFDPDAVDVSRESRSIISLRDDVLDEINQLYFERRRILAELRAQEDPAHPAAVLMRLRAEELAAGLDAWTDGWFSAQRARAGAL